MLRMHAIHFIDMIFNRYLAADKKNTYQVEIESKLPLVTRWQSHTP